MPFQLPARHRLLNRARSFLDESLDVINQIAKENQKVLDGKLRSLYNLVTRAFLARGALSLIARRTVRRETCAPIWAM